ncbi:MAG: histone deacetylase family protein, partial [Candidatus Competibacteraceae bacterium]|nr:histone deacetylase family protein [Candidatus Competibacteraceae bacterium]
HDTSPGHPESPQRREAILQALKAAHLKALHWQEASEADDDTLTLIHPRRYVERVLATIPPQGYRAMDGDTVVSPRSGEAARRAVGAVVGAVDAVLDGEIHNAFCAVRPPGHHAEPDTAMGFCLFNNIAIAAAHGVARRGLGRVAVFDFDVHHGNGTQAACWSRPELFYVSTHQSPLYPGTGRASERGGSDNILNLPLRPGSGSVEIRQAWEEIIAPALETFHPELILLSAGFDAHYSDPLAELDFTEEDYRWLTRQVLDLAAELCNGRVVSALEGGYNLEALATCVSAHVEALLER